MVEEGGNSIVHQGVRLDEVQVGVVQLLAVVRARACKQSKCESLSNIVSPTVEYLTSFLLGIRQVDSAIQSLV